MEKNDCRQAVSVFYRHFPRATRGGEQILYSLTHSTRGQPLFPIKCPYVLEYSACVFTLDYRKDGGGDAGDIHTNILEYWGSKIIRICVGKVSEQYVDGGEAIWEYPGTVIRLALARTPMPLAYAYGNSTSVGNGSAALVSSTGSDLAVNSDTNNPLEISDSK